MNPFANIHGENGFYCILYISIRVLVHSLFLPEFVNLLLIKYVWVIHRESGANNEHSIK